MEWLNKEYSIELHNPLTEEEWDLLTDVDMEHTASVEFTTKHGRKVEYVKVRHARWEPIPDKPEWDQKQCSLCKDYFCCQGNYCPNCGAKMDGGDDGTDQ